MARLENTLEPFQDFPMELNDRGGTDIPMEETETKSNNSKEKWIQWPWLPKEFIPHIEKITTSIRYSINETSYTRKLQYLREPIKFQTPEVNMMFGVKEYKLPNQSSQYNLPDNDKNKEYRYSVHLSLKRETPEEKWFFLLLEKIDEFGQRLMKNEVFTQTHLKRPNNTLQEISPTYKSAICYNYEDKTLPPVLRLKIKSVKNRLRLDIFLVDHKGKIYETFKNPEIHIAQKLLDRECRAICIFQINGFWKAGIPSYYGISYRLLQVHVLDGHTDSMLR